MSIMDIAKAVAPEATTEIVGIRPGEKLHEQMVGVEDAPFTYEYDEHYKILPSINDWGNSQERISGGVQVPEGFIYSSDNNTSWMNIQDLQAWIDQNKAEIGKI